MPVPWILWAKVYIVEIYSHKYLVVDGSDFTGTVCSLQKKIYIYIKQQHVSVSN